jgi:hypothetical protein
MEVMEGKQFIRAIGLAVTGCVAVGGANAQVTAADLGVNPTFEQPGPTTVTSTGDFFSGRAFVTSASDFAGGTFSYGGSGSPQTFSYVPPTTRGNSETQTVVFRACKRLIRPAVTYST